MKYISINKVLSDKISGEWGSESEDDSGVKIIRTANFTNLGIIDFSNIVIRKIESKKIAHKKLISGDVIIEKSGGSPSQPVGRVVYFENPDNSTYLCNNFTTILRPNRTIIFPKYLFYILYYNHMIKKTLRFQNKTTGIINLKLENYLKSEIPLPSLDDQIRIAAVLTRAEDLIAKRKESIKALDDLLKSIFLEMFGDPMRMRYQPKTKLDEFIIFLTSGSRGWAQYYSETGDIFIRINNVRDAYFKLEDIKYVNPPNNAETVRTKVRENDLLFSITADLGRTAVVNKRLDGAFINQHLALIRLKLERINPLFVAWYFAMPYGKSIVMKKNREGVKAGLNFDDIRGFEIITPPLLLQNQFAAVVEKVEVIKAKYNQSLANLEDLYGSLSQRAFKGELDLSIIEVEPKNEMTEMYELEKRLPPTISKPMVATNYSEATLEEFIKSRAGTTFSIDSLMSELEKVNYDEMPKYEELKEQIYNMLNGSKLTQILCEVYNDSGKVEKKIMLRANI